MFYFSGTRITNVFAGRLIDVVRFPLMAVLYSAAGSFAVNILAGNRRLVLLDRALRADGFSTNSRVPQWTREAFETGSWAQVAIELPRPQGTGTRTGSDNSFRMHGAGELEFANTIPGVRSLSPAAAPQIIYFTDADFLSNAPDEAGLYLQYHDENRWYLIGARVLRTIGW